MKSKKLFIISLIIFGLLINGINFTIRSAEGDYIDSWELTGVNAGPNGITTDGTNIWVVDTTDDAVYKYECVSLPNIAPIQSGEVPVNQSIDVSLIPDLYVLCTDADGNTMNATWSSNSSGSWIDFATNLSFANNTNITQVNTNFSVRNTKYYWRINLTDGYNGWDNNTYHFTTKDNTAPIPSGETPKNGSIDIDVTPSLYVTVNDADGDIMNATLRTNVSLYLGKWITVCHMCSNMSISDGTNITQIFTYAWEYSTKYYWSVNLSDGREWTNRTYHFTTEAFNNPPTSSHWKMDNLTYDFFVNFSDPEGKWMNYTIECNNSQQYLGMVHNTTVNVEFYNLSIGCTYTVWVNVTDGTIWYNATYYFSIESEVNEDDWLNIASLTLGTSTIIFIFWIFLVVLGEWKDDWLYKILQLPIGLTYGVTLLASDVYLGLGLIFASIYILSLAYWQSRKDKKEE